MPNHGGLSSFLPAGEAGDCNRWLSGYGISEMESLPGVILLGKVYHKLKIDTWSSDNQLQ